MALPARLRILLAQQGALIAITIGVIAVIVLASAGYLYLNPPTRTVTDTTNQQEFSAELGTSATVVGNSSLYEQGEMLTNMPVYLVRATPNLQLTVRTTVPEEQEVTVSNQLMLTKEAVRNGEQFFYEERNLINAQHTISNGSIADSATVNMSVLMEDVEDKREEIGGSGTFTTSLQLVVSYESERYQGELSTSTPIQFEGRSYLLDSRPSLSQTRSTSTSRTVAQPPDFTIIGVLGGLGILLLVGGVGVDQYRRRLDIQELRTEFERAQYQEWISEGEFPTNADNRFVTINSLEDLVDVAIDSEKRVIFDPELDAYAVVDGSVVYYFSTEPEHVDPWLDT